MGGKVTQIINKSYYNAKILTNRSILFFFSFFFMQITPYKALKATVVQGVTSYCCNKNLLTLPLNAVRS